MFITSCCIIFKLCIPWGERFIVIREVHTSLIVGHFGVGKTISQLQRYFNWSCMNEIVSRYVKGCSMCTTSKPCNRKLGLYTLLPIPSCPLESVSMDFLGGVPISKECHDYLYVAVDHFNKLCVWMPCKK